MNHDSELIALLKKYTDWNDQELSIALCISIDTLLMIVEGKANLPVPAEEQVKKHCARFEYTYDENKDERIEILKNPTTFFYDMSYEIEPLKICEQDPQKELKDIPLLSYGKICRYCGKREIPSPIIISPPIWHNKGVTTFKEKSHAISEMVGNHSLISVNECDECNHIFEQFENDFGYFTKSLRTFSGIKAKGNQRPILSHANEKIRFTPLKLDAISPELPRDIAVIESRLPKLVKKDKASGKKVIEDNTRYVPINVYKTLVKMALALVPAHELPSFQVAIDWLLGKHPNLDKSLKDSPMCSVILGCHPSPSISDMITIKSFKRKRHEQNVPYRQFCIAFANVSMQICLPFCTHDAGKKSLDFPAYTGILPNEGVYGDSRFTVVDFSSSKREKNPPAGFRLVIVDK